MRTCSGVQFLIVLCCAGAPAAAQSTYISPANARWELAPLSSIDGAREGIRWPSLATFHNTLVIAADLFPRSSDSDAPPPSALVLFQPGGRATPPDVAAMGYPKAIYDSSGALHLFWADFAQAKTTPLAWMSQARTIWHRSFGRSGWSKPERVVTGLTIAWNAEPENLATDATGSVHVLASVVDSTGFSLFDYRLAKGEWQRFRVTGGTAYASIASTARGVLDVVFTSSVGPGAQTELFETVSCNDGVSWSAPRRVGSSAGSEPQRPRVLALRNNVVALWLQAAVDGSAALIRADRNGASEAWTRTDSIALDQLPARLLATAASAASACASIVALVQYDVAVRGELHPRVMEADWRAARVHATLRPFPSDREALEAGITSSGQDFVAAVVARTESERFANFTARRSACER